MNRTKIKVIAGILVVFCLGMLIGVLGTGLFIRHRFQQMMAGGMSLHQTFFMRRLIRELKLTDAQKPEIEKILAETDQEMRQFFFDSRTAFAAIMQRRNAQMKEKLTPEQQQKLDALFERLQRQWHPGPFHEQERP